jgi:four helix bundle protein
LRLDEPSGWEVDSKHEFDLEERTARFGEAVIRFAKKIPRDPANNRLIGQIVGCSTSVGANYCEANENVSKKDFKNTIGRCVKEAKETGFSCGC